MLQDWQPKIVLTRSWRHKIPQDFESFKTKTLAAVKEIATSLRRPDGDINPFALGQLPDGSVALLNLTEGFQNDQLKDMLFAEMLPRLITEKQFVCLAIVNAVWTHNLKAEEDDGLVSPENAPDKKEAIVVTFFNKGGDVEYFDALVYRRTEKPPALGSWNSVDGDYRGRIIRPIVEALG